MSVASSYESQGPPSPPAPLHLTDICWQKAGYVATTSVSSARVIRIWLAVVVPVVSFAILVMGFDAYDISKTVMQKPNWKAAWKRSLLWKSIASTLLIMPVATAIATYVLALNHEFYCEDDPKWQNWGSEWMIFTLLPGWFGAAAITEWLIFLINGVAFSTRSNKPNAVPQVGWLVLLAPLFGTVWTASLLVVSLCRAWQFLKTFKSGHYSSFFDKFFCRRMADGDVEVAAAEPENVAEPVDRESQSGIAVPQQAHQAYPHRKISEGESPPPYSETSPPYVAHAEMASDPV